MSSTPSSLASVSYNVDIEAQNTNATALPSAPMPMLTHEVRTPARVAGPIDPMDDFFGYTLSTTRTQDSRHDENNTEVLPPYVEESNLPEYTPYAEPVTLAMYLFKFGFCKFFFSFCNITTILISLLGIVVFPPFWISGAFILLSPLREPPATSDSVPTWMPEKTESERQQIIAEMRKVELKWARRSLFALLITIFLAIAAGVTAWALMRTHH
jgi:hypothetical protein